MEREREPGGDEREEIRGVQSASQGATSPRVSIRQRSTPCQSGVRYASTSSGAGRRSIGKNVPEKRNIGRMTKRKIATNEASVSVCAPQAAMGAE